MKLSKREKLHEAIKQGKVDIKDVTARGIQSLLKDFWLNGGATLPEFDVYVMCWEEDRRRKIEKAKEQRTKINRDFFK